ncbi:MAG: chromate transporter [Paracoccaceae bacterium]|nr:MAG: chromate transporter [Paracoccaceae bacterium]
MAGAGADGDGGREAAEVLGVFLRLGLVSFGGPIAHLGYFRTEFVLRRRWIDEEGYARLVALCQLLPGPASSQVGFALGLMRAGLPGALAAWAGFTLPSALLMLLAARGLTLLQGPLAAGLLHGLKIVAVAVVAQAVWGMARSLAPDRPRAAIAFLAVAILAAAPGPAAPVAAIAAGAVLGPWLCRGGAPGRAARAGPAVAPRAGLICLGLFALGLLLLPLLARAGGWAPLAMADAFYRAGALVFGGGHVVLPLLQAGLVGPGLMGEDAFLAGYGAAQAMPGPLFAFAAYAGAVIAPEAGGLPGAALALAAIFLPGFLLLAGALAFGDLIGTRPAMQAAMRGANAAVVGVLGAALHDPLWTGAIAGAGDFALALGGFLLLTVWRAPPWLVVMLLAAGGMAAALV